VLAINFAMSTAAYGSVCGAATTSTRPALIAAQIEAASGAAPGGTAGPNSSKDPYVVRSQPGVVFKSILTTGDSVAKVGGDSYRMAGIPDGLGGFDNGDGTFTVLMNHELTNVKGVARAHGGIGAFVSEWVIRKDDLAVISGQDLIKQVHLWTPAGYVLAPGVTFSRFCSADLPAKSALYNAATGKGFDGRLFLDGEENGAEGRGFAHALDGNSYELPWLQIVALEDIGDQAALGKIWHYDPTSDALTQIAEHDPALFTPGSPDFITQDEETSGVIDVSNILGEGWYLLDDQVHAASADPELVREASYWQCTCPRASSPRSNASPSTRTTKAPANSGVFVVRQAAARGARGKLSRVCNP